MDRKTAMHIGLAVGWARRTSPFRWAPAGNVSLLAKTASVNCNATTARAEKSAGKDTPIRSRLGSVNAKTSVGPRITSCRHLIHLFISHLDRLAVACKCGGRKSCCQGSDQK
jgi:hypothetical protein